MKRDHPLTARGTFARVRLASTPFLNKNGRLASALKRERERRGKTCSALSLQPPPLGGFLWSKTHIGAGVRQAAALNATRGVSRFRQKRRFGEASLRKYLERAGLVEGSGEPLALDAGAARPATSLRRDAKTRRVVSISKHRYMNTRDARHIVRKREREREMRQRLKL